MRMSTASATATSAAGIPLAARLILLQPERILGRLAAARAAGVAVAQPNAWQLAQGVLRLWHRVLFRGDTVGTSPAGRVRDTWRARLLARKPLRLPALLAERAVAPLDFTGLASSTERLIRHLLGAHHDANQFVYDLEILACHPGGLDALAAAVDALLAAPDAPRTRWLRDLCVFDGYHEALRDAVAAARAHGPQMSAAEAADPDISFAAYLAWCAAQPATPAASLARFMEGAPLRFAPLEVPLVSHADATLAEVTAAPPSRLAAIFAAGHPLAPEDLADREYHGISLGLPALAERLTWKKFFKVFRRDPATGAVRGWNMRAVDDGVDAPWRPRERGGRPITFGHFAVVPQPGGRPGLLLDYGAGQRPPHPLAFLRDPLVALVPGSAELLLGRSLVAVAGRVLPTPSFFVLRRGGPVRFDPSALSAGAA